jgi:hypothetical protein
MTKPDLDHLVRLARRERPPLAMLEVVAHRLRVPFVVAPVAAAVLPSSAFAAATVKLGVSPTWLVSWGAGSALAVTGGALALTLATSRPSSVHAPPTATPVVASAPVTASPSSVQVAPEPEALPLATTPERQKPRDVPSGWDEPQLIERARKALGADPHRALALTQEYQRRFPRGALTVEREVIALEALARLGRSAEARRRALAFEAEHPTSIHLPRVRSLLARLGNP